MRYASRPEGPLARWLNRPLVVALAGAAVVAASGCGANRAAPPAAAVLVAPPSLDASAAAIEAIAQMESLAAEMAPEAVEPAEVAIEPVVEEPPVVPPPPPVPAAVAAGAGTWRPTGTAVRPYRPEIEQWRPLVRQALNEAAAEGRLWGPATRLDDDLLLAMIEQESAGQPLAESWAGAMGLLQLMPETFAELIYGDHTLAASLPYETYFEPTLNVRAGVRYMAWALQAPRGDVYWAVASYNAGVGATQQWRSVGLTAVPPIGGYTETAAYAPAILSSYARRRPDAGVQIPPPIPEEEIPAVVALLTAAGLW